MFREKIKFRITKLALELRDFTFFFKFSSLFFKVLFTVQNSQIYWVHPNAYSGRATFVPQTKVLVPNNFIFFCFLNFSFFFTFCLFQSCKRLCSKKLNTSLPYCHGFILHSRCFLLFSFKKDALATFSLPGVQQRMHHRDFSSDSPFLTAEASNEDETSTRRRRVCFFLRFTLFF